MNRDLLHRISALVLLALAACTSPTDESRIAYGASARVSGDTVFFDLTVTNRQESDLTLSTDSCRLLGPMLRVYDSGGALRFDEVQRPLTGHACRRENNLLTVVLRLMARSRAVRQPSDRSPCGSRAPCRPEIRPAGYVRG